MIDNMIMGTEDKSNSRQASRPGMATTQLLKQMHRLARAQLPAEKRDSDQWDTRRQGERT